MSDERFYQVRFIKVGDTILNPTHIVQVDLNWGALNAVRVYQVYQGDDSETTVDFDDNEAEALRRYFEDNSYDLLDDGMQDEGKPGTADLHPVSPSNELPF